MPSSSIKTYGESLVNQSKFILPVSVTDVDRRRLLQERFDAIVNFLTTDEGEVRFDGRFTRPGKSESVYATIQKDMEDLKSIGNVSSEMIEKILEINEEVFDEYHNSDLFDLIERFTTVAGLQTR